MNDEPFYLNVQVTHAHGTKVFGVLESGPKAEMLERMNTLKWDFANTVPASLELVQGLAHIAESRTAEIHIIPAAFLEQSVITMQVTNKPV